MTKQLTIEATARSSGSRPDVYRLLADRSTWTRWTPFSAVTLVEEAPAGGEGVGAVKQTSYRGMKSRERIVALSPDRQVSYIYIGGIFTPFIRDYVAVVDLDDDGEGTSIHWHSTFSERFPGSGWLPRRSIGAFVRRCAQGLASASSSPSR
jgi:uncharacterized protein YndB with AHSA1/START domain